MTLPKKPTIALVSPGDMGHAVGNCLRQSGLRVTTCLNGRSARTAALAEKAGLDILPDYRSLIEQADMILSIMVPAQALPFAETMAPILRQTGRRLIYVDCNAIAPATVQRIGGLIDAAGHDFVDAGIIGPPPQPGRDITRIYIAGAKEVAVAVATLNHYGLGLRLAGDEIGQASALKMCYAAMTKGTTALMTGLSLAAERLGVSDMLRTELAASQATMLNRMQHAVPGMIPKAHRWVGEMEEIAKTFEGAALTPKIFEGAADIYRDVAKTSLGQTTQEAWRDTETTFEEVIKTISGSR